MIPVPADTPLGASLTALEARVGRERLPQAVHRVDVDKKGRIFLQLARQGELEWFGWNGVDLEQRNPRSDEDLPFAAAAVSAAGRVLSYRPHRRLVIEAENRPTVIKAYRKGAFRQALRGYRVAAVAAARTRLIVPSVTLADHAQAFVELDKVEGTPLELGPHEEPTFFLVGERLRELQEVDLTTTLPAHRLDDELALLRALAARVAAVTSPLPDGWGEWFETLCRAPSFAADATIAHRDFYDNQILLDDERVALVDFDTLCLADPLLDAGNFLAHLALRAMQSAKVRDSHVAGCGQAFLEGLDRFDDLYFWPRLRVYEATAFMRLALVYWLRPRWRHVSGSCVRLAARCLDEVRAGQEAVL